MNPENFKIYGLCLERLKHQIVIARSRYQKEPHLFNGRVVLECYNTGDLDDIIDILELYDLGTHDPETLRKKLEELAEDASILIRDSVEFGFSEDGLLNLYLRINGKS